MEDNEHLEVDAKFEGAYDGDDVDIEETIITPQYADKIEECHYRYYKLPNEQSFEKLITNFQPDEHDKFLFPDEKDPIRLMHSNSKEYTEEEETKLKELKEHVKNLKDFEYKKEFFSREKRDLMRMLFACKFDFERIINEFKIE